MTEESHIRIGVLTRLHGLDGELRCRLDHQQIPRIFIPCQVELGYSPSFTRSLEMTKYVPSREGELLCTFKGINQREAAEELLEMALFVPRTLVNFEESFANPGIIGYQVIDEEGNTLGSITSISRTRAHHLWQIEDDGYEWLLPAIDEFVLNIDDVERIIHVRLIPGLYQKDDE